MRLNEAEANRQVQAAVDRLLPPGRHARVLEAGCGSASHIRFPEDAHLIGIDISQQQLDRNLSLHEKLLGDIQTYPYAPESVDAVICWDVLEHLQDPVAALRGFFSVLRPGGIAVLACPNPRSLKGLITRFTPHSFHVWSYRRMRGAKHAGTQDFGPFPTVMSPAIAPAAMERVAASAGLKVELKLLVSGSRFTRSRALPIQAAELTIEAIALLLRILSLGTYRGELSESRLVLRQCGQPACPDGRHTQAMR